jgi:hypothetical protein
MTEEPMTKEQAAEMIKLLRDILDCLKTVESDAKRPVAANVLPR